jgi:hypothetical protein
MLGLGQIHWAWVQRGWNPASVALPNEKSTPREGMQHCAMCVWSRVAVGPSSLFVPLVSGVFRGFVILSR